MEATAAAVAALFEAPTTAVAALVLQRIRLLPLSYLLLLLLLLVVHRGGRYHEEQRRNHGGRHTTRVQHG